MEIVEKKITSKSLPHSWRLQRNGRKRFVYVNVEGQFAKVKKKYSVPRRIETLLFFLLVGGGLPKNTDSAYFLPAKNRPID